MLRDRLIGSMTYRGIRARASVLDAVSGARRRLTDGSVALTFDDGPRPGSTDAVLAVLATEGVRATFFCVGRNALGHPELVRRILDEGHALGSHSFSHPYPWRLPRAVLADDYRRGRAAVAEVAGHDVLLFRPPHGHLDLLTAARLRRTGSPPWLWSRDPTDWSPGSTVAGIAEEAGAATCGDVVLLHDGLEQPESGADLDRSTTVAALPRIIARVRERGLDFSVLE